MKFQLNKSSVPPAIRVVEKNDWSIQTPNSLAVDCQSPKSMLHDLEIEIVLKYTFVFRILFTRCKLKFINQSHFP